MSYPEGTHAVTCSGIAAGRTSNGREQLAVSFTGDHGVISAYLYFTEGAMPHTEKALRTLGWDPIPNAWNIERLIGGQNVRGAEASIVVELDTYEGKTSPKVKWINEPGGTALRDEMNAGDLAGFTASLQRRMGISSGTTEPPVPVPVAGRAATQIDENDIPF